MTTVITDLKFINKVNILYFLALGMFRKVSFIVFKYTYIITVNFFFQNEGTMCTMCLASYC